MKAANAVRDCRAPSRRLDDRDDPRTMPMIDKICPSTVSLGALQRLSGVLLA